MRLSIAASLAITLYAIIIIEGRDITTICQKTDAFVCPSGTSCECNATREDGSIISSETSCRGPMTINLKYIESCECDDGCVCDGIVQSVQVSNPVPKCKALSTKAKCYDHCRTEFGSFDMGGTGAAWQYSKSGYTSQCLCYTCTQNILVCDGNDDDDDDDGDNDPSVPTSDVVASTTKPMLFRYHWLLLLLLRS
mmetsp:Transcript_21945/g.45937  ORF Transcript_21945/g.45937 Transcript_21945/m.45937 type:complete len:195 (+) Transcript_21945:63-647(+)